MWLNGLDVAADAAWKRICCRSVESPGGIVKSQGVSWPYGLGTGAVCIGGAVVVAASVESSDRVVGSQCVL